MPLYDFQCKSCGYTFEKMLSISNMKQPETEPCPECGEINVKKVIVSATPLVSGVNQKISEGFADVLNRVKEGHPGNNIKIHR